MLYIPEWLLAVWPWIGLIVVEVLLLAALVYGLLKLNKFGPQLISRLPQLNEALRAQATQLRTVHKTVDAVGGQVLQLLSWGALQKLVFHR